MKNLTRKIPLLFFLFLSFLAYSQTWNSPVLVEQLNGSGGSAGSSSSMCVVNGNPAIAYGDGHGNIMFARATEGYGYTWNKAILLAAEPGQSICHQIVNGNPAISYYDAINGNLKYVRATNVNGTAWGTPINVATAGDVGLYNSLKIVDGNPAISYYDATNGDLKYIRATSADGSTWGTAVTVVSTNDVGTYTSLEIVNGFPAISYRNNYYSDLWYVRATNIDGTAWGTPKEIMNLLTAHDFGESTCLKVINGNPAIAYFDRYGQALQYIHATNVNGTAWGTPIKLRTVASNATVEDINMEVGTDGYPLISYIANRYLEYIYSTDVDGISWGTYRLLDGTSSCSYASFKIINGIPGIAYQDVDNGDLKYRYAGDALGYNTWNPSLIVDDGNADAGDFSSLQIVNGNPAIAYRESKRNGDFNLKYVRATNAAGTTWGAPVSVAASKNSLEGLFNSLQIVSGNPAISYYDFATNDLMYVRASDVSGVTWSASIAVDQTGDVGRYTSLQVVSGNPAIAYYDVTNGNLKFVRATNTSGTTWGTPIAIDQTGDVGQYASLLIVNGNPAIAYLDVTNKSLKYVRATNATGTTWGTPQTIHSGGGTLDEYVSLQIVNGNPAVSYSYNNGSDGTTYFLMYMRAADASGASWSPSVTVDITSGQYTSLQVINGNPAIAYMDNVNYDLKYVRASDNNGTTWGTPAKVVTNYQVGYFASMVPMSSGVGIAYYNYSERYPYFVSGNICSNPTVPTLSASSTSNCGTKSTTLNITAGSLNSATTWQWYSGSCGGTAVGTGTTITVSPIATTTYYARGTGGCITPGTCASIAINVLPVVVPSVSITATTNTICNGTNVSFTATPVNGGTPTYQWKVGTTNVGANSPFFSSTTLANGNTVSVTMTSNATCATPASVTSSGIAMTVKPNPILTTTTSGNIITSNQTGATYQWINCTNGNTSIFGETNQNYNVTSAASYAVTVDLNGCSGTSNCVNVTPTGIEEGMASNTKVKIQPNPFSDYTILSIDNSVQLSNAVLLVKDALGKVVLKMENVNANEVLIHSNDFADGVYFYQLVQNNNLLNTGKLIIKR